MSSTPISSFPGLKLEPYTDPLDARTQAVQLAPSQNLARGTVMGQITTAVPAITGATNGTPIVITTASAHGLTTGQRISIAGVVGNIAANGTWVITSLTATTFSLNNSNGVATTVAPLNGPYTSGGIVTVGQLKAYASGNSDGSQFPIGFLEYDCQVDTAGMITFSATANASGNEHGEKYETAPLYIAGEFFVPDLPNWDATALTNMPGARYINNLPGGQIVRIG